MKTMNTLSIIALLLLGYSCSNNEISDNKIIEEQTLKRIHQKSIENEFAEIYLHQMYLENELIALNHEKDALILSIEENRNKKDIQHLEEVLEKIDISERYSEYNSERMFRLPPKMPGPAPIPTPCGDPDDEINCPIPFKMYSIKMFSFKEDGEIKVSVMDNHRRTVGELTSVQESERFDGFLSNTIEHRLENSGMIQISKYFEPANAVITYSYPVVAE